MASNGDNMDGLNHLNNGTSSAGSSANQVLDRKRLQELVKEVRRRICKSEKKNCLRYFVSQVDPNEQLDEDVEDLLLHIADDFIEQTITAACSLAKHRKATGVDVKDVQFVLG